MSNRYTHLLAPGRIGSMTLRNRILLTSMGVGFAEEDGTCGARIRDFNAAIASGGAALVTMGVVGVGWPTGANMPRQPALSQDHFIDGVRAVATAVHAHGARFAVQLHFGGLVAAQDMLAGNPAWAPSPPPSESGDMIEGFLDSELESAPFARIADVGVKVMSLEDIHTIVGQFAAAAARAREAGADGVEIHGGHKYLISSFLSPHFNRRSDAYGGALENRARLLTDIIGAIRGTVGGDFPVWCKLDSQEFGVAEGITLEDARHTAQLAVAAGADAITVTASHDSGRGVLHSESHTPDVPGLLLENAAAIRAAVDVPVIAAGRIEPELGDRRIAAGHCDFIAMGRKLLADPDLPRKLQEGRSRDIRPCIYCYTCISEIYCWRSTCCAVNPEVGFEGELALQPTLRARHIAVIGGGPGGMETARRLAQKGHRVTLIERGARLGGTLRFAAIAYGPNERLLRWLMRQVAAAPVAVKLRTEATPALLRAMAVDAVVVASGASRTAPMPPGTGSPQVLDGDTLRRLLLEGPAGVPSAPRGAARLMLAAGVAAGITARPRWVAQLSHWWMPLGRHVVIIGGELVGLELAEFLAHRGRRVSVLGEEHRFGAGLPIVRRWRVLDALRNAGVTLLPRARDIVIGERGVNYRNVNGQQRGLRADHVIVAAGARGDMSLAESIAAAGFEVHTVGDCRGVGYIAGAMRDAARVAQSL